MEMNHSEGVQISVTTDSFAETAFDNRSQSSFCNRRSIPINSNSHFTKPRFSSCPRIPLSVNRAKLSVPYKSQLCKLFQRGKCYFGGSCHCAHNISEIGKMGLGASDIREDIQRNDGSRVKECYFSSSGMDCPYGENCLFLHRCDENVGNEFGCYRGSYAINVVNGRIDGSGRDHVEYKSLIGSENYPKLHFYKSKLCIKWERFGSCPYGIKCTYAHGKAELQERGYSSKLEGDLAFRSTCQAGIKIDDKMQMTGKRGFMKSRLWKIENISEIYADWPEVGEIPMLR